MTMAMRTRKKRLSFVSTCNGLSMLAMIITLGMPAYTLAHNGEEHGDHDARHAGFVIMYKDIHFEVVAQKTGAIQLYYTDAARAELPAATVSDVAVEIEHADKKIKAVAMNISASGDFWEGSSDPAVDTSDIIRVGFVYQGEPLLVDVPASAMPDPAAAAMHEAEATTEDSMPAGMDHTGMSMKAMPAGMHDAH